MTAPAFRSANCSHGKQPTLRPEAVSTQMSINCLSLFKKRKTAQQLQHRHTESEEEKFRPSPPTPSGLTGDNEEEEVNPRANSCVSSDELGHLFIYLLILGATFSC